MGDENRPAFTAARDALRQAREDSRWPTNNLNRNKQATERLLIALGAHRSIPEVAYFIECVWRNPTQVDNRELHYMQRRYLDGVSFVTWTTWMHSIAGFSSIPTRSFIVKPVCAIKYARPAWDGSLSSIRMERGLVSIPTLMIILGSHYGL